MALIKCKECSSEISTKAEACPKCGAKVLRTTLFTKIVGTVFGFLVLSAVIGSSGNSSNQPPKTPDQIAAEKKADEQDTQRFIAARAAARAIKSALRDPDSLQFEAVRVSDNAKVICAEYRAKNGFGGTNRESIVFVNGSAHKDAATWNKNCAVAMSNYLYAVK